MNDTKRQVLPRGLWVVATPIGNLEDLSPRARQAIREAAAVLCEDTSRTSQMLSVLGISKSLLRLDAHATDAKINQVVSRILEGENMALVSDAGTPAVSDPGAKLVDECWKQGVRVTPIPGPSAVPALLSVAGFSETEFSFRGFFPRKDKDRLEEIEKLSAISIYFESPQRIGETLDFLTERLGRDDQIIVGKELTKIHEKLFRGRISEVKDQIVAELKNEGERGEWCFAIRANSSGDSEEKSSDYVKALHCLLDARITAPEAARQVSQHFGVSRKMVYELALKLLGKKSE